MALKFSLIRIYSLIIKEILTLIRDPKGRLVLIVPPLLQLLVFSFAATLDVSHVHLAVNNQDSGGYSRHLLRMVTGSPFFTEIKFIDHQSIQSVIDEELVLAVLVIPTDFSRDIAAKRRPNLQIIFDGRHSNTAQIVNGYFLTILQQFQEFLNKDHPEKRQTFVNVLTRTWFNPNLNYFWFTVPSLVCVISMLVSLMIAALSIARERELGTLEQLLVSPLTIYEIMWGKMIPAVAIGMLEGIVIWFVAEYFYGIPFYGSPWLMVLMIMIFILSIVGIGLFISAVVKTQQQAFVGVFFYMVPAVNFSGYAAPIENMPLWLQKMTVINPLKHGLILSQGLFLKESFPLHAFWNDLYPLIIFGGFTFSLAIWSFKKHLG